MTSFAAFGAWLCRFDREYIHNCLEADAAPGSSRELLLVRTKLIKTRFGNLDLHVFHASDGGRELHDHPWSFVSLILWNGYTEVLPTPATRRRILAGEPIVGTPEIMRRRRRPGSVLVRQANWAHRVELEAGKISVSLIWTFPKRTDRDWGFFTRRGWVPWREYHHEKGCP